MSENASEPLTPPPRRETFLARYPRNVKMAATVVILALIILPPAWIHGRLHQHLDNGEFLSSSPEMETGKLSPAGNKVIGTDINAPALNDQNDRSIKLVQAPDRRVTEDTPEGPLPRISEDGLLPWQIYARPFNTADRRPRIAIVITGLGLSPAITDQAISQLPPTVTLALDSQGPVVAAWGNRARQDGHEILLQVPMEPFDYPRSDPGPMTLLTNLPNSDNLGRLLTAMRHAVGYVGITTASGSRFTTDSNKYMTVLEVLHKRGLMVVDTRTAPHGVVTDMAVSSGVPVATVTQRLDTDLSPDAIAAVLDDLEKTARQNGRAIGVTAPTPLMLNQLQAWAKTLPQRGIALAPISAMVQ